MGEPLPEEFAAALEATARRRGPLGQSLVFLSSTGSTNDVAQKLADHGALHGTVVLALAQTEGRGRQGRAWFSPPGAGLYLSVLIRSAAIAPMLTLAGGVAVADAVDRATGLPVNIKWPNDIVVRDERAPGRRRKLAGILAEASTGDSGVQHVVLGIGINVRRVDYPPDLAARVTSLEHELGRPVDAGLVLAEILAGLNEQITALESGRKADILTRWRSLSPGASGTNVSWNEHRRLVRGVTAGIDDDGALLIRTGDAVHRVVAGEVEWE